MKETTGKITFKGGPLTLLGEEAKVGQVAPDFTVIGAGLNPIKLSDYKGKVVVMALYPSIDTGVCQLQNKRFNAEASNLGDAVILSISCDLPFAQSRFCAAEGLDKVITASDHKDVEFGTKYGFLIKELRLLTRGTVIVDKAGVIQYVEICPEVTNEPDYESALAVVKKLL